MGFEPTTLSSTVPLAKFQSFGINELDSDNLGGFAKFGRDWEGFVYQFGYQFGEESLATGRAYVVRCCHRRGSRLA
jgi:hypothetical protein